jgi:hypothetical protein
MQSTAINPHGGIATPVAVRLADRDLERLAELAEREGLSNVSVAIRLAVSAGLDQFDRRRARRKPP